MSDKPLFVEAEDSLANRLERLAIDLDKKLRPYVYPNIQVPPPDHVKFTKDGRAYADMNHIIDTELDRVRRQGKEMNETGTQRLVCPECSGDHYAEEHDAHELHHQRLRDVVVEAAIAVRMVDKIAKKEKNADRRSLLRSEAYWKEQELWSKTDALLQFEQEPQKWI